MPATIRSRISDIVDEAYREHNLAVTPLHPNVLVRLLPRTHISKGGIIMPDKQNKPLVEAVVLETFVPFYKTFRVTDTEEDGRSITRLEEVLVTPLVEVGDHVVFHHFEGAPIPPLDAGVGEYRAIDHNKLLCKLDYEKKNATRDWLNKVISKSIEQTMAGHDRFEAWEAHLPEVLAEKLGDQAHIIRKDMHCVTLSGV